VSRLTAPRPLRCISSHTVESYYARIQQKLRLDGMYELRRHAIDHFQQPR
jgi:DNA-binding NarL/FixJ family response regulator